MGTFFAELNSEFNALSNALKTILIIGIVALVYFTVSDFQGKSTLDNFNVKYKAFQDTSKVILASKNTLLKTVAIQEQKINQTMLKANLFENKANTLLKTRPSPDSVHKLEAQIDSLKKTIKDSVELARVVIPKQDTVIQKQDSTIKVDDKALAQKDSALIQLRTAEHGQTMVADSLKKKLNEVSDQLKKAPAPPKPERFLGIFPEPSRKVAGAVGYILGILTVIEVSKVVK